MRTAPWKEEEPSCLLLHLTKASIQLLITYKIASQRKNYQSKRDWAQKKDQQRDHNSLINVSSIQTARQLANFNKSKKSAKTIL